MSKQAVGEVLARMVKDAAFRKHVEANPSKALAGYDLTPQERERFSAADVPQFNGMINKIWDRASLAFGRNIN